MSLKRAFDGFLSLGALLVLSPGILLISLLIKLTSPGPIFYRGQRVGYLGKSFKIWKFRTMVVNAERIGGSSTSAEDPRITNIGQFLRKYKLDELPQLFNVFVGEMSFVGPRPEVQEYVDLYTVEEQKLLKLRPGITDWASIWNSDEGSILAGHPDPDQAYLELIRPTKLKLQLFYANNSSLFNDLKIIGYTFYKLIDKSWIPSEIASFGRLEPVSLVQKVDSESYSRSKAA